jgi:hypothetical protein
MRHTLVLVLVVLVTGTGLLHGPFYPSNWGLREGRNVKLVDSGLWQKRHALQSRKEYWQGNKKGKPEEKDHKRKHHWAGWHQMGKDQKGKQNNKDKSLTQKERRVEGQKWVPKGINKNCPKGKCIGGEGLSRLGGPNRFCDVQCKTTTTASKHTRGRCTLNPGDGTCCTCAASKSPIDVSHISGLAEKKVVVTTVGKRFTRYIDEWISYHLLLGVHHIYVGVNECGDDLVQARKALQKHVDAGKVTYDPIAECKKQLVHVLLLNKVAKMTPGAWVIALDSDEFVVIKDPLVTIGQMAAWFEGNHWVSVYLQWRLFGTSGIDIMENGSAVTETFSQRFPTELDVASFNAPDKAASTCDRMRVNGVFRTQGKSLTRTGPCKGCCGGELNHHRSLKCSKVWGLTDGKWCGRAGKYGCECSKTVEGVPASIYRCNTASNAGPMWINHYIARGEKSWQVSGLPV